MDEYGYRCIRIDGMLYEASALAIFYMTGRYPTGIVDHVDRRPVNNSFDNLRETDYVRNAFNSGIHADNVSGFKGAYLHKQSGRYESRITVHGKRKSLGLHDTPEQAHDAYMIAAASAHGEFFNEDGVTHG